MRLSRLYRRKVVETKEYNDCKLACINTLQDMMIAVDLLTELADKVEKDNALPGHMAVRCLINSRNQAERALLCFLDHEDNNITQN
jgi:hypothetical protein